MEKDIKSINKTNSKVIANIKEFSKAPLRDLAKDLAKEQDIEEIEAVNILKKSYLEEVYDLEAEFTEIFKEYLETKDQKKFSERIVPFKNEDGWLPGNLRTIMFCLGYDAKDL